MQELIVALIVACATFAVARRYMPPAIRNAVRAWGSRTAERMGWRGLAKRLEAPLLAAQGCGSGCGACGGCSEPANKAKDSRQFMIKKI